MTELYYGKPLSDVLPGFVLDFIRMQPQNATCYWPGVTDDGAMTTDFFVRCSPEDVDFIIEKSTAHARLTLVDADDDSEGPMILMDAKFFSNVEQVDEGVQVAMNPEVYGLQSEFPKDLKDPLGALAVLIKQPVWRYIFVSDDCEKFLNAKAFDNPLTEEEKDSWSATVEDLISRCI
jgi:hypothetical protein